MLSAPSAAEWRTDSIYRNETLAWNRSTCRPIPDLDENRQNPQAFRGLLQRQWKPKANVHPRSRRLQEYPLSRLLAQLFGLIARLPGDTITQIHWGGEDDFKTTYSWFRAAPLCPFPHPFITTAISGPGSEAGPRSIRQVGGRLPGKTGGLCSRR